MNHELNVVKYLNQGHPLESLTEKYAIKVKRHPEFPRLALLSYDQIKSDMSIPLVRECRGIILNENNNYYPVLMGPIKFGNYSEGYAAPIDWTTARCLNKIDGSMVLLGHYEGSWRISTTGSPDASGEVGDYGFTFKELFWKTWGELGYKFPEETNLCYMFELVSPFNRIVVRYPKPDIILWGVRNMTTLEETRPEWIAELNGWHCVESYPLQTLQDILKAAEKLDPMNQEGFVVCDDKFNRQKVKSASYVALHHSISCISVKSMLLLILSNEQSEFLSYFPELENEYKVIEKAYRNLLNESYEKFAEYSVRYQAQKDFAIACKGHKCFGAFMAMKNGKVNCFEDYYKRIAVDNLIRMLGVKEPV